MHDYSVTDVGNRYSVHLRPNTDERICNGGSGITNEYTKIWNLGRKCTKIERRTVKKRTQYRVVDSAVSRVSVVYAMSYCYLDNNLAQTKAPNR